MAYVTLLKSGLLTTIQDLGREQYQHYGISVSGAMDRVSLKIANILVGNPEKFAAVEMAVMGSEFLFHHECVIAVTGGNMSPQINGKGIRMWRSIAVQEGDRLSFGKLLSGCYTYVAFSGGVQVPEVLGSKATFIRGSYGGFKGRALRKGDKIEVGSPLLPKKRVTGRRIPNQDLPLFDKQTIRFIWGPHDDYFTDYSKETFCSELYQISNQSDRMGYRLKGTSLERKNKAQILSDYIAPGSIQVPGNGLPIVLMADCQMSGGYTKIGMVIGVDIPSFAQKKPGERICFKPVSVEQAQSEWIRQEKWLTLLAQNNID